jgi:hypothetical protein
LIKTGDNAPIDGTLKTLSDGNGNNLPMAVSTTAVNFTNQLQQSGVAVPTASQVAAKQDTLVSGTNIKTINGTSVLGSGNIVTPTTPPSGVAGAIQFSNGSAFASDAANLFWDDTNKRLGIGTNVPTSKLTITDGASSINFGSDGGGAFIRPSGNMSIYSANSSQFAFITNSGVGINVNPTARFHIKGSGSTSATTSLLVQNSAGTAALTVRDDLSATFGGSITTSNSVIANNLAIGTQGVYFQAANNTSMVPSSLGWNLQYAGATNNVQIGRTGFTGSRESSASLQVDATTQGFLPPRMTTTQKNAIASPAAGLVVYDSTLGKLCVRTASAWETITSL